MIDGLVWCDDVDQVVSLEDLYLIKYQSPSFGSLAYCRFGSPCPIRQMGVG